MRVVPVLWALAVAASTLAPSYASAQDEPRRPTRALFGGAATGTFEQSLTASGSVGAGYDTDTLLNAREAGFTSQPVGSASSVYSLFSGGLRYSVSKRSFSVGMSGSASRRYYPAASTDAISSYTGGAGITFTPSVRTSFNFDQS